MINKIPNFQSTRFDGVSDKILDFVGFGVGNAIPHSLLRDRSYAIWVKLNTVVDEGNHAVISNWTPRKASDTQRRGIMITFRNTTLQKWLRVEVRSDVSNVYDAYVDQPVELSPANTDQWVHLVFAYDADGGSTSLKPNVNIYINGIKQTTVVRVDTLLNTDVFEHETGFCLGSFTGDETVPSYGRFLDGVLSDCYVYDYFISDDDVKAIYNGGRLGDPRGVPRLDRLLAHFPLGIQNQGVGGFVISPVNETAPTVNPLTDNDLLSMVVTGTDGEDDLPSENEGNI